MGRQLSSISDGGFGTHGGKTIIVNFLAVGLGHPRWEDNYRQFYDGGFGTAGGKTIIVNFLAEVPL